MFDPFTQPRERGQPVYWLDAPDAQLEAKHLRLMQRLERAASGAQPLPLQLERTAEPSP